MATPLLFARRLREAREHAGFTHAVLAATVGRSEQSARLWERGRVTPPRSVVVRLARVLDAPELLDAESGVRRSREAQGLPRHVEDPAVLAQVATTFGDKP